MKPGFILYVTTNCPTCHQVVRLFNKWKINFEERNLDDADVYAEAVTSGLTVLSAPILVIGRRTIFKAGLLHRNELEENLRQIIREELGKEV